MRFARTVALVGVALLFLAFGPWVLLAAAATLFVPRVRAWVRPGRRAVLGWVLAIALVAGLAVVVPDGWVRIPPGPGVAVTPAYVGRPALGGVDRAPGAARGPLGESPGVTARSYGIDDCRRLEPDGHGRLVTLCGGVDTPVLRLVDAGSLRQLASKALPARGGCPGAFALDPRGRVVVAAGDRLLVVATADAEGAPDLTTAATVDPGLPDGDCVAGVAVGDGRTWFASRRGMVGVVDGGKAATVDLGDAVTRPLAADATGAYVATAKALRHVVLRDGRPVAGWSSARDGGGAWGSAPVPLAGGLVAIADDRDPRLQVVFHSAGTGLVVCRAEVFGDDAGAADGGLVAAGPAAVVVTNAHGYAGPLSTVLGRTTDRGIARVDAADGACRVTWTSDFDAPSGAPAVSLADGLVYAYLKRHSWLGADAWYLAAIDLRTGRLWWARRTGLGVLRDNHHGEVTLGPDHAAYVPVLGGLVRVRDRE